MGLIQILKTTNEKCNYASQIIDAARDLTMAWTDFRYAQETGQKAEAHKQSLDFAKAKLESLLPNAYKDKGFLMPQTLHGVKNVLSPLWDSQEDAVAFAKLYANNKRV